MALVNLTATGDDDPALVEGKREYGTGLDASRRATPPHANRNP